MNITSENFAKRQPNTGKTIYNGLSIHKRINFKTFYMEYMPNVKANWEKLFSEVAYNPTNWYYQAPHGLNFEREN